MVKPFHSRGGIHSGAVVDPFHSRCGIHSEAVVDPFHRIGGIHGGFVVDPFHSRGVIHALSQKQFLGSKHFKILHENVRDIALKMCRL